MDESLVTDLRELVGQKLVEARELMGPNCLPNVDPEKWCDIAGQLLQGKSKSSMRIGRGGKYDVHTIDRVAAFLEDSDGVEAMKRRFAVRSAAKLAMLDSLQYQVAEGVRGAIESGEYTPTPKDLQHIAVAAKVEQDAYFRARGEATVIVEERKVITTEDVMDFARRAKEMLAEGAIDAEVVED